MGGPGGQGGPGGKGDPGGHGGPSGDVVQVINVVVHNCTIFLGSLDVRNMMIHTEIQI